MAYIGKNPTSVPLTSSDITDSIISLPKLTDGTDGNLISYDASGNPVAVATGSDGQVLTSTGAGSPPVFEAIPAGGITEADQFRLTASLTSDVDPISSNLERVDSDGFGKIGTGMSLSSGIYTFPSTGTYLIILTLQGYVVSSDNIVLSLFTTTDNSSYNTAARVVLSGTNSENLGSNFFYFNVSNTSTHKAKFVAQSIASGSSFSGSTDKNGTCFSFIRLGDST